MMTGYASVDTAVQALKHGAYDYITKPVDPDELSHLVANALEHKRARREVVRLRENLQEVFQPRPRTDRQEPGHEEGGAELIEMVAPTEATVLITAKAARARKWWRAPSTPPVRGATCPW
jgi:DNA-binding NtrC family response regulator